MTAYNLLHPDHIMVGVDPHDAIFPPRWGNKVPFVPHIVSADLRGGSTTGQGAFAATVFHVATVKAWHDEVLQRATDIGEMIAHAQYNALLAHIMADSASVSTFGASTVRAGGRPVATAVLQTSNINLNCGDPMDGPTGYVAAANTVRAGMTEGDLFAGLVDMIYRMARSMLEGVAFDALPAVLAKLFPGISRMISARVARLVSRHPRLAPLVEKALDVGFGKAVGEVDFDDAFFDGLAEVYDDPKHRVFL